MNTENCILGAFAGDIIGSSYEFDNVKSVDFEFFREGTYFTDDSVLTAATMDVLLNKGDYQKAYQEYGRLYPHRGYGGNFKSWIYSDNPVPYNSWGNGSAMRVSPVGWYCNSIDAVLAEAKKSAEVSHNHPEGIKGAQAAAAAVYLARSGKTKIEIKQFIVDRFGYNLDRTIDKIRPHYDFDVSY
jgi:ADP-ribosylglycohydrolase